jgi:nucleoside-diphosphate-sugar epimerase
MNYFIAGAAGFIGSTFTKRLLADEKCEKIAPYLLNIECRSNDKSDLFKGDIYQLN